MTSLESQIQENYGEKLRVRVCGIASKEDEILLVKHKSLGETNTLYAPPGGGMQYGESAKDALKREFREETNLEIEVEDFLFVHEYLDPPLHGIELFFKVKIISGNLKTGFDPEMEKNNQLIADVKFHNFIKLQKAEFKSLHYVLRNSKDLNTLINQKGFFKFH